MILQSLVALAEQEGLTDDPAYEEKEVQWLIDIDREGTILSVTYTGTKIPGEPRESFPRFSIPKRQPGRTSGVKADLLVDNARYLFALGEADGPSQRAKLELCARASIEQTARIATATGDAGALAQERAQRRILADPGALEAIFASGGDVLPAAVPHAQTRTVRVPRRWKSNHLFAFTHQETGQPALVSERPLVRKCLAQSAADDDEPTEMCLVTGRWCKPVALHKGVTLAGDTGPVPLLSFNNPAFLHQRRTKAEIAPMSAHAANAYVAALQRLLDRKGARARRSLLLTENTTVLFWSVTAQGAPDPLDDPFLATFFETRNDIAPDAVRGTYAAPFVGRAAILDDATPLFTLVLTREKSRVVLRTAELHTVGSVANSVRQFFDDLNIAPAREGERPPRGLRHLLDGTLSQKSTASSPAPDLAARLYLAALDQRRPLPPELLASLLRRIRTHDHDPSRGDTAVSTRRVALIKAVINRTFRNDPRCMKEISMALDIDHPSPAYQLGRAFAVLEKTQQEATNAKAGIADRFLGTAMAAPALVLPRLFKLSHHHREKIGGVNRGRQVNLEKLIDSILLRVSAPLPRTLSLVDQGTFILGYHHQRAELWSKPQPASDTATLAASAHP
ncbi:MAG: type I-C CRISPR-associated protein Cas8c/Csd1 [Deltaproteobacteria bacterium]|nr:type I-C CRISPR-associated protein Cas8c/Csd1 [Deltaproteobacteria bacterium]